MTTELEYQNLAVARRFVEQFLGKGDITIVEQILDENVQVMTGLKPGGPIQGRDEYKQIFSAFFDAFPPVSDLMIEEMFAVEDRVVVRFCSVQKHTKDFLGVAATDRVITLLEAHIMRLRDGKIIENIVSATNLEFEMLMAPVLAPLLLK